MFAPLTLPAAAGALFPAVLAVTTAILAPVVCLATVVLVPFSDRKTQVVLVYSWTSYVLFVGAVLI